MRDLYDQMNNYQTKNFVILYKFEMFETNYKEKIIENNIS
jgi:hypothetical protein